MIRAWGSDLKGRVVHLISLVSDDLRANISTYGAVLQDLRCNDLPHSLVLGFPNLQPYLTNPPYLGAIVGRYANRIAKARIDGATDHQRLDANQDGLHCLHGGSDGSSSRLWAIIDSGSDFVTLEDIIPDGHMGFVGTLRVKVRYQLAQSNLKIDITATSDAASLCNLPIIAISISTAARRLISTAYRFYRSVTFRWMRLAFPAKRPPLLRAQNMIFGIFQRCAKMEHLLKLITIIA